MPRARALPAALLVAALLALGACGDGTPRPTPGQPETPGPGEYLPGLGATVSMPDGDPDAVVVLVPGGGWRAADPAGLRLLGADLAAEGFAAVTVTYGHAGTGTFYPRPVEQVACAVAFAATQAPGVPVVVVGHSAGANLAVLVGLQPLRTDVTCPYEPRAGEAIVGLAGPYDVHQTSIGENLFGVPQEEDPELWRSGNPLTWVSQRTEVPVLLVHGRADDVVPMSFTDDLAVALEAGGHDVVVDRPLRAGHDEVIRSRVVLDVLAGWIRDEVVEG